MRTPSRNYDRLPTRQLEVRYDRLYRRAFVRGLKPQDEADMAAIARVLAERKAEEESAHA